MADNLPLIPNQSANSAGGVRGVRGVRGVLREVLGEQTARLPAVPPPPAPAPPAPPGVLLREAELRCARAEQLALPPPPHPYELGSEAQPPPSPRPFGPLLLQRSDLMPAIHQNATRKTTLWVRNTLGYTGKEEGEGDGRAARAPASRARSPLPLLVPLTQCSSTYSLSMGEPVERVPPKTLPPPPRTLPEHVICVPSAISFVNFTVGNLYTTGVRLMNVSRAEVRLAVRPPARRELDVQLCGRLVLTSGASAQLCVHFRPLRLRELRDRLAVRVSSGRDLVIPIDCYLVPPTLDVLMPHVSKSSVLSCELAAGGPRGAGAGGRGLVGRGEALLDLGARLLGELHSAPLVLRSSAEHALFFVLSDDAWCSEILSEMIKGGALATGPFALYPGWWRGGGTVRGAVSCSASRAGLHAATLRVLTSTSVVRPLYIIADSLYFHPEHVSLRAQDKNYDILSDYDPNCEYYVNLGIAFPHRKLSETVQVINHSPLTYSFYWSVREWGVCSCEESDPSEFSSVKTSPKTNKSSGGGSTWSGPVCPGRAGAAGVAGAAGAAGAAAAAERERDAAALGVQPLGAAVAPRSSLAVHVAAADVGHRLGLHRAVLLLILKDVPRKSFPPGIFPQVVSSRTILQERVNGIDLPRVELEVCEVVVCQMEVWWTVAPLRFVLDPPYMELPYSRRLQYVELRVRATLLYRGGSAACAWRGAASPPAAAPAPAAAAAPAPALPHLSPGAPAVEPLLLPLVLQPNQYSRLDTIKLEAERREWSAACVVSRRAELRHPALRPVSQWLGLVLPGSTQRALLAITNDTFQPVYWWADPFRIYHQVQPKPGCSAALPCDRCFDRFCSCTMIKPMRGGLEDGRTQDVRFKVTAPMSDGLVLTLLRVRRTEAGVAGVAGGPPAGARSALLAYRTLAPAVTLAVLQCSQLLESSGCPLTDAGDGAGWAGAGAGGGRNALLRPAHALVAGLRNCYRMRLRNITSVPTYVQWQPSPDGDTLLRVIFIPDQFTLVGFTEIEISVVLEARRVCSRRLWLRAAAVRLAYQPLYLVVDAAIQGLEIEHWIPLADELICLRRIQREVMPWHEKLPTTPEEAFIWDDHKRAFSHKSVCRCGGQEMCYVSPPPRSPPAPGMPSPPVSAVWSPPPLTRVCACWAEVSSPPYAPELPLRPLAIQFRKMTLNTVFRQRVRLRNISVLTGKWSSAVRLGAMPAERRTIARIWDPWAAAVRECGVAMRVAPAAGLLPAGAGVDITLSAYADTWGVYHDQLLIMVERFTPLVVDVWAEALGCPLRFPLRPGLGAAEHYAENTPMLWVSDADEEREVRAENASRAALVVQAFLLRDHGAGLEDAYPFRLVLRLFDMPPRTCPCTFAFDSDDDSLGGESALLPPDVDTGCELYLAPDYGVQDHTYYMVEPHEQTVGAGGRLQWSLVAQEAEPLAPRPPHTLLFRVLPLEPSGPGWTRSEPTPAAVRVRTARRAGADTALQLSRSTVTVRVCALAVPENEVIRVRKHIMVQNIGSGTLNISASIGESVLEECAVPPARAVPRGGLRAGAEAGAGGAGGAGGASWALVLGERHGLCGARCQLHRGARMRDMDLALPPDSSTEVVVEVAVSSAVCPPPAPAAEEPEGVGEGEGEGDGAVAVCREGPPPPLYATSLLYTSQLNFYDEFNIHKSVSLCLRVDRPALRVEPALLELGYVCDDDVRKTYFSVSHTSCLETVCVWVCWVGPADFRLSPRVLWLRPGVSARVYVQYLARYTAALVGGYVDVRVGGSAGAWCRARVCVRARAARDFNCHRAPHDHTDALLPPPGPDANDIF